jgi:hypothetical protein
VPEPDRPLWGPPQAAPPAAAVPHALHTPPQRRPDAAVASRPPARGAPNPPATWSVILGSISLVLLVLSLGIWFPLTVPLSIAALVLARAARRRLDAGIAGTGSGAARAGRIIAIIGIVLGILAAVVWVVLLATGFSLDELRDDLERELERRRNGDGADGVDA